MSYYDWNNMHQDQNTIVDKDNHNSVIGRYGGIGQRYTDPLAMIFGDKYLKLINEKLPNMSNKIFSKINAPAAKWDKATNPLRRIGIIDKGATAIENKPADAIATAAGAYFGGSALGNMMGGGSSGGGSPVTSGGPARFGQGSVGNTSPNTGFFSGINKQQMLANLLKNQGNSMTQMGQQQSQQQQYQRPTYQEQPVYPQWYTPYNRG